MISRRFVAAGAAAALGSALSARFLPALADEAPSAIAPVVTAGLASPEKAFAQGQLAFAGQLMGAIARKSKNQNIIVSPMSAAAALAIIAAGSDPAMTQSLHGILQFAAKPDDGTEFAAVLEALVKYGAAPAPSPLLVASQLVLDPGIEPEAAAIAKLRGAGVEVAEADLADPATVVKINAWVKRKTGDLIASILDQPPGKASLVALNALYFKDKWLLPFDPAHTADAPFTGTDGKSAPVPMMSQSGSFSFRRDGEMIGVDLGFTNKRYALVIVTSTVKPEPAGELIKASRKWLGGAKFAESPGSLTLPRLNLEGGGDLLEPLRHLGLQIRPGSLRGFGAKPPQISAILQKAVLKLDEEGAEAAAATAVIATRSVNAQEVRMVVDKPFVFALRDIATGFVVLSGYVARP